MRGVFARHGAVPNTDGLPSVVGDINGSVVEAKRCSAAVAMATSPCQRLHPALEHAFKHRQKLVVEGRVEDKVEGHMAEDEEVRGRVQVQVEAGPVKHVRGLTSSKDGVRHVQVAQRRRHDADDEGEDDGDERNGQATLLPAPLRLHVVADVHAFAYEPRAVHGKHEVGVGDTENRQRDKLKHTQTCIHSHVSSWRDSRVLHFFNLFFSHV